MALERGINEGNKKYSVVKFLVDDSYSEIPSSWLMHDGKKQMCVWPPRTANAASLITNCTSPNFETWTLHEVVLIKENCKMTRKNSQRINSTHFSLLTSSNKDKSDDYPANTYTHTGNVDKLFFFIIASLESARKSAVDSSYETTGDEDTLGRGKRQHMLNNKYNSEEDEYDTPRPPKIKRKTISTDKIASSVPPCPDNFTINDTFNNKENVSVKNVNDAINCSRLQTSYEKGMTSTEPKKTQVYNISDVPVLVQGSICSSPSFKEVQEVQEVQDDSNIIRYLKELMRKQATSSLMLQDVKQRITNVEEILRSRVPVSAKRNDSLIAEILPLQTVEAIRDFDALLRDTDEAVIQFRDFLLRTGGNNPRDNVHRILPKIFTNECAMNCSWKGIRKNFKVSDLYFIKIMRREITTQHATLTEAEFDNIVAEWLRFAKQRKQRGEKEKHTEQRQANEEDK